MIDNTSVEQQINCYVDWTPDGLVTLSHIWDTDDLDSLVLRFTPARAYKLAQMLITAAEAVELP